MYTQTYKDEKFLLTIPFSIFFNFLKKDYSLFLKYIK